MYVTKFILVKLILLEQNLPNVDRTGGNHFVIMHKVDT